MTSHEELDLSGIERQGWRQGCILPVECHTHLTQLPDAEPLQLEDACIVVSQSCDLVHCHKKNEPYTEILIAKPLPGPADSRLRNRRNPRQLHFDLSVRGTDKPHEAWAWKRCRLARERLLHYQPDTERFLSDETLRVIVEWLAARYRRVALPSTFQRRLRPVQEKLRKTISKLTDASAVFIALNPRQELSDTENYNITLILSLPVCEYEEVSRREAMESLLLKLTSLFSQCKGIELDEETSKVECEDSISLTALRGLIRWEEFDYVSYQGNPTHGILPYSEIQ